VLVVWQNGADGELAYVWRISIWQIDYGESAYGEMMSYQKVVHHFVILLTVTDLNRINFVDLSYSFIFQQSLIKIYQLFPNYTVNY